MAKRVIALVFLVFATFLPAWAGPGVFEDLAIVTSGGTHKFQVEVMRSDEDRERGMMFRKSLDPDKGMLFDMEKVDEVAFWMKNTYVPLDIIFIRADGVIHRIEENAEPLSTTPIPSGAPVLGVLELLAGSAKRLSIHPGDRVENALFGKH